MKKLLALLLVAGVVLTGAIGCGNTTTKSGGTTDKATVDKDKATVDKKTGG